MQPQRGYSSLESAAPVARTPTAQPMQRDTPLLEPDEPPVARTAYEDFASPDVFRSQPRTTIYFETVVRVDRDTDIEKDVYNANQLVVRALATNFKEVNWATPLSHRTQRLVFGLWFELVRVIVAQLLEVAEQSKKRELETFVFDRQTALRDEPVRRDNLINEIVLQYRKLRGDPDAVLPAGYAEETLRKKLYAEGRDMLRHRELPGIVNFLNARLLPELELIERGAMSWLERMVGNARMTAVLMTALNRSVIQRIATDEDRQLRDELAECERQRHIIETELREWRDIEMRGGSVDAKTVIQWREAYSELEKKYKTCLDAQGDVGDLTGELSRLTVENTALRSSRKQADEFSKEKLDIEKRKRDMEKVQADHIARQLADERKANDKLTRKLDALTAQLATSTSREDRAALDKAHKEDIKKLKDEHQDHMKTLRDDHAKELERRDKQRQEEQRVHAKAIDDLKQAHREELEAKQKLLQDCLSAKDRLDAQIVNLNTTLAARDKERADTANRTAQSLTQEREVHRKEKAEMAEKFNSELERRLKETQDAVAERGQELERRFKSTEDVIAQRDESIRARNQELEERNKRVAELESARFGLDQLVQTKDARITELVTSNAALERAHATDREAIVDLRARNAALETQLDQLRQQRSTALSTDVESLKLQYEQGLQAISNQYRAALDAKQLEFDTQLATASRQLETATTQETQQNRGAFERLLEEQLAQSRALETQLQALGDETTSLIATLRPLESARQNIYMNIEQKQSEIDALLSRVSPQDDSLWSALAVREQERVAGHHKLVTKSHGSRLLSITERFLTLLRHRYGVLTAVSPHIQMDPRRRENMQRLSGAWQQMAESLSAFLEYMRNMWEHLHRSDLKVAELEKKLYSLVQLLMNLKKAEVSQFKAPIGILYTFTLGELKREKTRIAQLLTRMRVHDKHLVGFIAVAEMLQRHSDRQLRDQNVVTRQIAAALASMRSAAPPPLYQIVVRQEEAEQQQETALASVSEFDFVRAFADQVSSTFQLVPVHELLDEFRERLALPPGDILLRSLVPAIEARAEESEEDESFAAKVVLRLKDVPIVDRPAITAPPTRPALAAAPGASSLSTVPTSLLSTAPALPPPPGFEDMPVSPTPKTPPDSPERHETPQQTRDREQTESRKKGAIDQPPPK